MRWGICGTGHICEDFVDGLRAVPGAEVVAVASRHQESADRFGEAQNIPQRFAPYEKLAECADVDIVYVGVLNPYHAECSLLFINAGKHVVCEKPVAMNAKQLRKVVDAAKTKDVFFMEAMWTRFFKATKMVLEILDSGSIGEVRSIMANFCIAYPESARRIWEKAKGGGALLDTGIYPVSFVSMVCKGQRPEKITAVGVLTSEGVDEGAGVSMLYPDGVVASITSSARAEGTNDAIILCTKGRLVIPAPFFCPTKLLLYHGSDETPQTFEFPLDPPSGGKPLNFVNSEGLRFEAQAAQEAIEAGQKEMKEITHEESVLVMQNLDEIRRQIGLTFPADDDSGNDDKA